jgi:hypothetical protein
MTTDDLRAIADRILLEVVQDHPDVRYRGHAGVGLPCNWDARRL